MSKTLKMLAIALAMGGLAATALPTASAMACATHSYPPSWVANYVGETCNYVVGGEGVREAGETAEFLEDQAVETVLFLWEQYGDQLP